MRPRVLTTCLASLCFLIASAASPRDVAYRVPNEHLPEVVKSVTQDLEKEPTCDELRAMWRFSKRQSRAAVNSNEIPTYRDPFAFNVWEDSAIVRSIGGGKMRRPLVYGRLVHSSYQQPRIEVAVPGRIAGYDEIARMFGNSNMAKIYGRRNQSPIRLLSGGHKNNARKGSFQHLKQIIQSERSRELHEQNSQEAIMRNSGQQSHNGLVSYYPSRSRPHLEPIVNFPTVLTLSDDYYKKYNYMQRKYPNSLRYPGGKPQTYSTSL